MSASFFASIYTAFGKYDVVHFHVEGSRAMIWFPNLFGKRCIVIVHGIVDTRDKFLISDNLAL